MDEQIPPTHPGEVLWEDFMKPLGLSAYRVAKDIGVTAVRINEIVRGKRGITPNTAVRLARYFGTSTAVWLRLQLQYDLEMAEITYGDQIRQTVQPLNRS